MGASGTGEDGVNSLQRQSCTDYSKNWTKHNEQLPEDCKN